ncbi:MAG: hypothetical protein KAT77_00620 [Nanoarchaeota archaeon]|nr:hypothetical protein [Nanoarchaeota archaeon]
MVHLTKKGKQYLEEWRRARGDFSDNIPSRLIIEFPVSGNEGLYGQTIWPNDGRIWRREDLRETYKGVETDIHECNHDEWEYRTRLITREHMKAMFGEEKNKYDDSPEEYKR